MSHFFSPVNDSLDKPRGCQIVQTSIIVSTAETAVIVSTHKHISVSTKSVIFDTKTCIFSTKSVTFSTNITHLKRPSSISSLRQARGDFVSKMLDGLCIIDAGFCIKNTGNCLTNARFCIEISPAIGPNTSFLKSVWFSRTR